MFDTVPGLAAHFSARGAISAALADNPSASAGAAAVDLRHLGRFTLGDRELEREVLGLFLEQLPETIKALKYSASNRDWMMAAHTLKGSSRAVGAWSLADLALQAEEVGTPLNTVLAGKVVTEIEAAAADVARFVNALTVGNDR